MVTVTWSAARLRKWAGMMQRKTRTKTSEVQGSTPVPTAAHLAPECSPLQLSGAVQSTAVLRVATIRGGLQDESLLGAERSGRCCRSVHGVFRCDHLLSGILLLT